MRSFIAFQIEKGLISEIPDCRSLAFETMGIMGVFDKEFARQRTVLVKDTLELVDSLKVRAKGNDIIS